MKTGNIKVSCPKCGSKDLRKNGYVKRKKNQIKIREYKCFICKSKFTKNSISQSSYQKRPDLNEKVMGLYCEGNTLRGISRLLNCDYKTVVRKFRFMANLARNAHLKNLFVGEIKTTYIQIDEMETFEHTKDRPLGIQLAIRPKTSQIVSARVCRIPLGAKTVSPKKMESYNAMSTRFYGQTDMCIEVSKVLKDNATIKGDGSIPKVVKNFFNDKTIESVSDFDEKQKELWAINHLCAKLRHHMSRLNRKTWATTKNKDRLQMHLDLFIAYQNGYKLVA